MRASFGVREKQLDIQAFHNKCIVVDTHVDTVLRITDQGHDLALEGDSGYMDVPKMLRGNLSASFFACFVDPRHDGQLAAQAELERLIEAVETFCEKNNRHVRIAKNMADVRANHSEGRLSILLAIEGSNAIGDKLHLLERYAQAGVKYITLTHFASNAWCDSSTDVCRHHGLSGLGVEAIREMERNGIAVDLSHASDATFWQALDLSGKPPMVSHSSARGVTDHPRNLTDAMAKALADKGGLIGITWWPEYIRQDFMTDLERHVAVKVPGWAERSGKSATAELIASCGDDMQAIYDCIVKVGVEMPTIADMLAHVDHLSAIVGSECLCFGSDHGAMDFHIRGVEDCSCLPELTKALLARGYTPEATQYLLGNSVLAYFDRLERWGTG